MMGCQLMDNLNSVSNFKLIVYGKVGMQFENQLEYRKMVNPAQIQTVTNHHVILITSYRYRRHNADSDERR